MEKSKYTTYAPGLNAPFDSPLFLTGETNPDNVLPPLTAGSAPVLLQVLMMLMKMLMTSLTSMNESFMLMIGGP